MQEVELYTRNKEYVQTVVIPSFLTPPDVIMWGNRTFQRTTSTVYHEAFMVVALYTKEELGLQSSRGGVSQPEPSPKEVGN